VKPEPISLPMPRSANSWLTVTPQRVNLRIDGWRRTRRELLAATVDLPDIATPDHAAAVVARNSVVRALARLPSRNGAWSSCAICST
jgi:DNA-directed RNA polymerase specialized sigma24 family protein